MSLWADFRRLVYVWRVSRRNFRCCSQCGQPKDNNVIHSLFGDFDCWECPDCDAPESSLVSPLPRPDHEGP